LSTSESSSFNKENNDDIEVIIESNIKINESSSSCSSIKKESINQHKSFDEETNDGIEVIVKSDNTINESSSSNSIKKKSTNGDKSDDKETDDGIEVIADTDKLKNESFPYSNFKKENQYEKRESNKNKEISYISQNNEQNKRKMNRKVRNESILFKDYKISKKENNILNNALKLCKSNKNENQATRKQLKQNDSKIIYYYSNIDGLYNRKNKEYQLLESNIKINEFSSSCSSIKKESINQHKSFDEETNDGIEVIVKSDNTINESSSSNSIKKKSTNGDKSDDKETDDGIEVIADTDKSKNESFPYSNFKKENQYEKRESNKNKAISYLSQNNEHNKRKMNRKVRNEFFLFKDYKISKKENNILNNALKLCKSNKNENQTTRKQLKQNDSKIIYYYSNIDGLYNRKNKEYQLLEEKSPILKNENNKKVIKDENNLNNSDVSNITVVNQTDNQDMNNGSAFEEDYQRSSDKENSQELKNEKEQKGTKDENNMISNKNITDKVDQLIIIEKCFYQIIREFIPLINLFIDQVESYSGKIPLRELTKLYQSIEYHLIEQLNILDEIETDNIKVKEKNIFTVELIQNLFTQINKKKKELITKKINYINS